MKIGLTYNLKDEVSPLSIMNNEFNEEFDSRKTIDALSLIFEKYGFKTAMLGARLDMADRLKKEKIDFVFNIAEGYYGRNRESFVPSVLEAFNIPYSGSDPLTLGMTLDKIVTKKLLHAAKIPTPAYYVVRKIEDIKDAEDRLEYPVITKPAWEGSSKGVYNSSKALDKHGLKKNIKILFKKYPNQPVLVEEYIKGREITVGVIGNEFPKVMALMEIVNKKHPGEDFFYSLEVKRDWENLVDYESPPRIHNVLETQIRRFALMAYREFGCRDVSRIDFRISEYNDPYLLEINPLPGLSPEYGDLAIMARKNKIAYEELVISILNSAFSRYGIREVKKKSVEAMGS
ncbi:MAG: ATP-grasp domain-containing protein [Candidatus Omnitrophica bacterium]|nr:ATP-grasp domain-containing protein [Candidatus Omnitrophota bacterium]MBU4590093.1 ATP-grasp domain-containing protein [Candidatus Omnitrophota bacterium]